MRFVVRSRIKCVLNFFLLLFLDDGQPEDIGYGYQKKMRNLENIFEQAAAPSGNNKIATKDEIVEKFLDYLANESPVQQLPYKKKPWSKKSIFREREDTADVPDNLQQLKYDRYAAMPSAFRERYKTGVAPQDYSDNADDQDDYLYAINALVDKYIEDNVEGMSDEELESFLRSQDEKRNGASPADEYRHQGLYAEPYNYYKRERKPPAKRQFLFIPRYHPRRNNKYGKNNRWMKPRLMKRSKKNISTNNKESRTDPKVAAELNNIFLGAEPNDSDVSTTTTAADMTNSVDGADKTAGGGGNNTKIELKKKSIDWSNYFGYDRK